MQKEKNKKREEEEKKEEEIGACEHLCDCCSGDCFDDDFDYDGEDEYICEECLSNYYPRRRELGRGMKERSCRLERCPSKAIVGLIVLAFGVLYLGRNLAWWSFNMNWSVFWPIVIIVCGLLIIFNSRKNN